jgi:hypothetical protein
MSAAERANAIWAMGPRHPERVRPVYVYRTFQCVGCRPGKTDGLVSWLYCDRCWIRRRC